MSDLWNCFVLSRLQRAGFTTAVLMICTHTRTPASTPIHSCPLPHLLPPSLSTCPPVHLSSLPPTRLPSLCLNPPPIPTHLTPPFPTPLHLSPLFYLNAWRPDAVPGSHFVVHLLYRPVEGGVPVLLVHVVVPRAALVPHPQTEVLDRGRPLLEDLNPGGAEMGLLRGRVQLYWLHDIGI